MNLENFLSPPTIVNEKNGILNEDWISQLQELKFFKIFIPNELGGLGLNLLEATPYLLASARFHGSLGWIHNLVAGANSFCTCFEEDIAYQVFKDDGVMCSGSGTLNGSLAFISDQMEVNGKWTKCTGAQWATHFTAVAKQDAENPITFICPANLVKIKKDWFGFGMKATSTDQIEMIEAKIPINYQFEVGHQKSFFDYPIAQINFVVFAKICMSITFEGLVSRLLDLVQSHLNSEKKSTVLRINKIKKLLFKLNDQRANSIKFISQEQKDSKIPISEEHLVDFLSKKHMKINLQVEKLIQGLGMIAIDERNHIHWAYRDIKVAIQHYFV